LRRVVASEFLVWPELRQGVRIRKSCAFGGHGDSIRKKDYVYLWRILLILDFGPLHIAKWYSEKVCDAGKVTDVLRNLLREDPGRRWYYKDLVIPACLPLAALRRLEK